MNFIASSILNHPFVLKKLDKAASVSVRLFMKIHANGIISFKSRTEIGLVKNVYVYFWGKGENKEKEELWMAH